MFLPVTKIFHVLKAQLEKQDLEKDVCRSRDLSLHLVPYTLKVNRSYVTISPQTSPV
jgi:hypothetical protein